MRHFLTAILILAVFSGCSAVPFQDVLYVLLNDVQPLQARENFASLLPSEFNIINSIVFKYRGQTFTAIGYTAVDSNKESFVVAGLNPTGAKLFEMSGLKDKIECGFMVEEFKKFGDFAGTAGKDIGNIYFQRIPDSNSSINKEKSKIIFTQSSDNNRIKYVFAGAEAFLVEKHCFEGNQKIWSVFYYEYQNVNGKLYPSGIVYKNHRYGYQLIIYLKEIRK